MFQSATSVKIVLVALLIVQTSEHATNGQTPQPKRSDMWVEDIAAKEPKKRLAAAASLRQQRKLAIEQLLKVVDSTPDKPLKKGDPRLDAISLLGEYRATDEDVLEYLIANVDLAPPKIKKPAMRQYPCVKALIKIGKPASKRAAIRLMQLSTDKSNQLKEDLLKYVIHKVEEEELGELIIQNVAEEGGGNPERTAAVKQQASERRVLEVKKGKGTPILLYDITGSERLLNDLTTEFVKAKAAVQLKIHHVNTRDQAIEKFFKGGSELLLLDRPMTVATVTGKDASAQFPLPTPQPLRSAVLGRMAVGVIVHPKNMLDALPLNELQSIFCGEIKHWPAADRVAGTVRVYGLLYTNPISQLLQEKLPGKLMTLKHTAEADSARVILEVAKDPFAIGFVDLSQLSPDEKSVKLVGVYLPGQPKKAEASTKDTPAEGGSRKTKESVVSKPPSTAQRLSSLAAYQLPEDYPLVRTYTLYVSPKASETAKDFARFVASDRCAETLLKHNLLPPLHVGSDRGAATPTKPRKPYLGSRR